MNDMILNGLTKSEFFSELRNIVKETIQANAEAEQLTRYLSPAETKKLWKPAISDSTLWNWVNQGKIKKYQIGGKVFYKYSEVIEAAEKIERYQRKAA